jgi:hypothetical protein
LKTIQEEEMVGVAQGFALAVCVLVLASKLLLDVLGERKVSMIKQVMNHRLDSRSMLFVGVQTCSLGLGYQRYRRRCGLGLGFRFGKLTCLDVTFALGWNNDLFLILGARYARSSRIQAECSKWVTIGKLGICGNSYARHNVFARLCVPRQLVEQGAVHLFGRAQHSLVLDLFVGTDAQGHGACDRLARGCATSSDPRLVLDGRNRRLALVLVAAKDARDLVTPRCTLAVARGNTFW